MARFPVIPAAELTDNQRLIEKGVRDIFSRVPPQIEWRNPDGLILGPYSPLFYAEDLVDPWFKLGLAATRQQQFTIKEKELVVLAVLAEYDAPYVLYAHSEIALSAGLSKEQVQKAVDGQVPDGLDEPERIVYSMALTLVRMRRPLESDVFEQANAKLGRERLVGLAHLVSSFIYVTVLTNLGDAEVPPAKEGMFIAKKSR